MKGAAEPTIVHFRGEKDDWVVFIDEPDQYKEWKQAQQDDAKDEQQADDAKDAKFDVPLFVEGKDAIFVTNSHGPQGTKNTASKSMIASEFGTEDKSLAIKHILLKGTLVEIKMSERQGSKNDSMGAMSAH